MKVIQDGMISLRISAVDYYLLGRLTIVHGVRVSLDWHTAFRLKIPPPQFSKTLIKALPMVQ